MAYIMIRLNADLPFQGRLNFALVTTSSREKRAAELNFDEDLVVKYTRSRVERGSGNLQ